MFPCISVFLWTPLPSFCLRASSDSKEIPPPLGTTNAPSHPAVDNTMNLPFPWVMLATYPGSTGIQPSRATAMLYAGGSVGNSRQMYCAHSLCSPRRSIVSLDHHQDTSPEVKLQRISRQQHQSLKARGAGPGCHHPPLAPCHLWDLLSSTSISCSLTLWALELFLFIKKCQVTPCLHFLSLAVFSAWNLSPWSSHTVLLSSQASTPESALQALPGGLSRAPGLLLLSALLETAQETSISFNWPCFMKTGCWWLKPGVTLQDGTGHVSEGNSYLRDDPKTKSFPCTELKE